MTDDIDTLIADLRAKAEKATPGPWVLDGHNLSAILHCTAERGSHAAKHVCGDYDTIARCDVNWQANAAYIAAANPQNIASLLAAFDAMRERAEKAEFNMSAWKSAHISIVREEEAARKAAERKLAEAERQRDAAVEALKKPFCVLFLDGRNEHGSHVLPAFPCSFDLEYVRDLNESQSEAILVAAESAGFVVGEDYVWAEFTWIAPQIDEYGRVEFAGYWEFDRINAEMTQSLRARAIVQEAQQ
jgi:hypothetical protein